MQEMLSSLEEEVTSNLFAKKYPRRLELGTLLKDHDDQYFWSSWFAAANPVNNTDFQLFSTFVLFK